MCKVKLHRHYFQTYSFELFQYVIEIQFPQNQSSAVPSDKNKRTRESESIPQFL